MRKVSSVRVTPALVISIVALVLAAGGTSFASAPIAFVAKTVGLNGKQKSQVKSIAAKEIKAKAPKLSVLFASSAGSAASSGSAATAGSATNATNATNATKATTATTATTASSLSGVQIVAGPSEANPSKSQDDQTVVCPSGMHALGGGVEDNGGTEQDVNEMFIESVGAGNTDNAFEAFVNNTSTSAYTYNVWAICANAAVTGAAGP